MSERDKYPPAIQEPVRCIWHNRLQLDGGYRLVLVSDRTGMQVAEFRGSNISSLCLSVHERRDYLLEMTPVEVK